MTVFDTVRPVYAHLYVHLFMTVYINSLVLKVTVCVFMNSKEQDDIF